MGDANEAGVTDVVVVGGGPAGWAASLQLNALGLDVVLLERGQVETGHRGW